MFLAKGDKIIYGRVKAKSIVNSWLLAKCIAFHKKRKICKSTLYLSSRASSFSIWSLCSGAGITETNHRDLRIKWQTPYRSLALVSSQESADKSRLKSVNCYSRTLSVASVHPERPAWRTHFYFKQVEPWLQYPAS